MLAKFDSWLYANESVYTRSEKSENFWKVNGQTGNTLLLAMRLLACMTWVSQELPLLLYEEGYLGDFLKFYTNWTWYIWGVWLTCITYSHIIHEQFRIGPAAPTSSPFQLWKVCSTLFSVCFLHSIMITSLWYGLIYPTLDPDRIKIVDYVKHSMPAGTLFLEFLFNRIVIEARYIIPVLVFGTLYLLWLIYYTLSGDRWLYSVLKLDTPASWALLGIIILCFLIVFTVLFAASELKFTLFKSVAASSRPKR